MRDITNKDKTERFGKIHSKTVQTFTGYNDLSYTLFKVVSKFSELFPRSLTSVMKLSDMITDAIVVSGRSSLSKNLSNTSVLRNTLEINHSNSGLSLKSITNKEYSINIEKSSLQSNNNYSIYSKQKESLSSFKELLRGSPIVIENDSQYFKYTLGLVLEERGPISCIDLELSSDTGSYPLISEVYYISRENKRVYCTILNSMEKQYNLDSDRQIGNKYQILLSNVVSDKIYLTVEDRDKTSLSISKIGVRSLNYKEGGELIIGPIVSQNPILKASVEAEGSLDFANFYLSPDAEVWHEVATPLELSFDKSLNKILSFNTISNGSLKSNEDFKELYLKVILRRIEEGIEKTKVITRRKEVVSNVTLVENSPKDISVYEVKEPIHYGGTTFKETVSSKDMFIDSLAYVESKGDYFVKGLVENNFSITAKTEKRSLNIYTKPLKIGGDNILATTFDPTSTKIYGYTINTISSRVNTKTSLNNCLIINPKYNRDTYTIRQNNKEINLDFNLGYISSTLEAIVSVFSEGKVQIFDSVDRLIKDLEIKTFEENSYVDLIEEGFFLEPKSNLSLNTLYPIRLNREEDYSLLDGKVVCKPHLVDFENLHNITLENITFDTKISKENGNTVLIEDTLLKEKYTEQSVELIPAYSGSSVIKLNNKHIKKGSLKLSVL